MKCLTKALALVALLMMCLALSSCGGQTEAIVTFPKDTAGGYVWDAPEFDEAYFKLVSQRSYTEQAPGLPSTQYHEWKLAALQAGTVQVVFTQYDSKEDMDMKTDPFRKVTITYEIAQDLTLKEIDRLDLNYKQDE